jgi:hypothetical protein
MGDSSQSEEGGARSLRCDYCGRAVHGTRHKQNAYEVDYYSLHTGVCERATFRSDDVDMPVSYLKLVEPLDDTVCRDCYSLPAVRRDRELRFRPELAETDDFH